jgi:mono/diheme cytochrome c family protein
VADDARSADQKVQGKDSVLNDRQARQIGLTRAHALHAESTSDEEDIMRFLRDALITVVLIVVVVVVMAYVQLRAGGLAADTEPGRLEQAVAGRLLRLSISSEAEQQQNPFRADATAWQTAVDHYKDHCAVCHGSDGHGQTEMGENMYPKVPDLAGPPVQGLSDGALFSIIQNGVRWTGMPAWKSEHSHDETWRLVSFVRHVPSLTAAELDQLRHDDVERHHHQ